MDEFHSKNNSICHSPLQRAALFTFLLAQVGARVMLGLSTFQIVSGFSSVLCFVPCGIHEKPKESDPYSESHGWDGWDGWDGWGSGSLVCRELGLENLGTFGGMVLRIKSPWQHSLGVSFWPPVHQAGCSRTLSLDSRSAEYGKGSGKGSGLSGKASLPKVGWKCWQGKSFFLQRFAFWGVCFRF